MTTNDKTVRIFTMPLQYPCGPQSSCCGPVGQSEEDIERLKQSIEKALGVEVEVRNVVKGEEMKDHHQISGLFRSFGPISLPIITLGDEVISMGRPAPEEAVASLRSKVNEIMA